MKNLSVLFVIALLCFTSCKTAEIILPKELETSDNVYQVEGKRKMQWKKRISFGNYTAKETQKSFPTSSKLDFGLTKGKAKHNLQFELTNPAGKVAQIYSKYNLETKGINVKWLFPKGDSEIILEAEDSFIGNVQLTETKEAWNFLVSNIHNHSIFNDASGIATNGTENIEIKELIDVGKGMIPTDRDGLPLTFGFEFIQNQEVIGAVRLYNGGKVWMKDDISEIHRDIVASLSAALMMRNDFQKG